MTGAFRGSRARGVSGVAFKRGNDLRMFPSRIVCLSGEAADICIRLGAGDRVVGVSAFAPKVIRSGRKIVGGFSTLKREELLDLAPDLVITFSDVQADISSELIRNHCTVLATNQRSLRQISEAILLIGRIIGCHSQAEILAAQFENRLGQMRFAPDPRPRVYFEEWDAPMVSGIGWISESIEWVGGKDICFRPEAKASQQRCVESSSVCNAQPEIIFACWCGKPVDVASIANRPGWEAIPAIRNGHIHVLDAENILQPGPRVLNGIQQMRELIERWACGTGQRD